LNAARRDAEERNGEATEESLEDYNKYAEFGQRISSMAEGIRTDETTVEDLVKEATSRHLQVLEDVRQKLPPQAQQEFQRAQEAARKVQELRPAIPTPTRPSPVEPQLRQPTPQQPTQPEIQQRQPIQPGIPQIPVQPQTQPEVEREAPQQIPGGRP
jgi:hypothetical protein